MKMKDSIALDRSSQSTFTKAVKNIKTLIKKSELKNRDQSNNDAANATGKKAILGKKKAANQQDSKSAWKKHGKGVVYLSHIPEGFYEEEMHSYFSQFGRVTRLNLVRSEKNGKPKGYAFVEFLYSEVAQVVAETMNNYLMCDRLLKAEYISGDRTYRKMFRNSYIRPDNCPRSKSQKRWIQNTNKKLTPEEEAGTLIHEIKRLNKLKEQLEKSGVQLDCQIESSSLTPLNSNISKTGRHPILEVDESDVEIEFKLQPNVIRVLKRRSVTSVPSPNAKKVKAEAKKDVSKTKPQRKRNGTLAVKRRSLSMSLLPLNVKKLKAETGKDVSKNNLQHNVTSVMKQKSFTTPLLPPDVKKVKARRKLDISGTKSQLSVTKVVEQKSFSTSMLSPSVKKVKAGKDVFKNRLQPNVTPVKKRKSFSTSLLSMNVKKVKAKRERDVSNTKSQFIVTEIVEHKPVSTSDLSLDVKKVRAEAEKDVSHIKLQPKVTEVVEDKSLSLSMLSPSVKNVGAESEKDVSNTNSELTVTKVVKHKSLSKSILSSSVKKVKAEARKGGSSTKSEPSFTRVVKCKRLPTSIISCSVKKVKAKGGCLKTTRPPRMKQGVSMRCDDP